MFSARFHRALSVGAQKCLQVHLTNKIMPSWSLVVLTYRRYGFLCFSNKKIPVEVLNF